jgi:heat-inducible transcriptional repressor
VEALQKALNQSRNSAYVEGTSNIALSLDLTSNLKSVLELLEQQLTVVSLLRDVMDRGMTVAIGSESGIAPLAECSLVLAPYEVDGERAGTIGVLGPTRMNYTETVAAVAVISQRLSKMLTEGSK